MISFKEFLEQKPLYYREIDHKRVAIAYNIVSQKISHPKAVHLIGTNGKGSTGRTIAYLAFKSGVKVGHYSSPHILKFNERIWISGKDVDDASLEDAHQRLYQILGDKLADSLSYFEYTTLLAVVLFEELDLIVLEAGLGGEYDATTTLKNRVLSVVTPIGFDHQSFLGESIEEIATTKLKSVEKSALIAPQIYDEVEVVAKKLSRERNFELKFANLPEEKSKRVEEILRGRAFPEFLISNIKVAVEALDILGMEYDLEHLGELELFGRFYSILSNLKIDVGHNLLSAEAIFPSIQENSILIYNTLADKDFKSILQLLKPKISKVEIIDIETPRAVKQKELERVLSELDIPFCKFEKLSNSENYLVFGSFYTVEAFLRRFESLKM